MEKTAFSSLSTDVDGNKVEENFFTYDENERQQIEINKSNASHVFTPLFIPYYPHIKQRFDLSDTETLLYGFISFYKTTSSGKFYFTNSQLGEMLCRSEKTISLAVSALCSKGIIKTYSKIKAGGGEVRFVELTGNLDISGLQNVKLRITKGNGNNNKIKEKNICDFSEIVSHFNMVWGSKYKLTDSLKNELSKVCKPDGYSVEEIKQAITEQHDYGWTWAGKEDRYSPMPMSVMFRTRNKNGDCDYIAEILNRPENQKIDEETYNDRKSRGWEK